MRVHDRRFTVRENDKEVTEEWCFWKRVERWLARRKARREGYEDLERGEGEGLL